MRTPLQNGQWGFSTNPRTKKFFQMWRNMMDRCYNPKNKGYIFYGGRGIQVCERWHDFENFLHDEYEPFYWHWITFGDKNTTIDRTNNEGNYTPDNIQYSSNKAQSQNQRMGKTKLTLIQRNNLIKSLIRQGKTNKDIFIEFKIGDKNNYRWIFNKRINLLREDVERLDRLRAHM